MPFPWVQALKCRFVYCYLLSSPSLFLFVRQRVFVTFFPDIFSNFPGVAEIKNMKKFTATLIRFRCVSFVPVPCFITFLLLFPHV